MELNYRRCVSCRKVAHKTEFWRIIRLHSSQAIALDQGMGRSAYLCPQADCLRAAQKKNRLAKALKAPISETVYADLWQRLTSPEPVVSSSG